MNICCWFKKLWIKFKWVEVPHVKQYGVKNPRVWCDDRDIYLVVSKINSRAGKTVLVGTLNKDDANVIVSFKDDLPQGVDGRAYASGDGIGGPHSSGYIYMRTGLDTATFQAVLAHELLHILGHWHHGTSYLMQPKILSCMGLDALLDEKIVNWIKENV